MCVNRAARTTIAQHLFSYPSLWPIIQGGSYRQEGREPVNITPSALTVPPIQPSSPLANYQILTLLWKKMGKEKLTCLSFPNQVG